MRAALIAAALLAVAACLERKVDVRADQLLREDVYYEVNCTGTSAIAIGYNPNYCYASNGDQPPFRRVAYNLTGSCHRGDAAILYASTETCSSNLNGIPLNIGSCTNQHLKVDCLCGSSDEERFVSFGLLPMNGKVVRCGTEEPPAASSNVLGTPFCGASGDSASTRVTFAANGTCRSGDTVFLETYPDAACSTYPASVVPLNRNMCREEGDAMFVLTCPCEATRAVADIRLQGFAGSECSGQAGVVLQSTFDGCMPFDLSTTQFYSIRVHAPQGTCQSKGTPLSATFYSGPSCSGHGIPIAMSAGQCAQINGFNVNLSASVECW